SRAGDAAVIKRRLPKQPASKLVGAAAGRESGWVGRGTRRRRLIGSWQERHNQRHGDGFFLVGLDCGSGQARIIGPNAALDCRGREAHHLSRYASRRKWPAVRRRVGSPWLFAGAPLSVSVRPRGKQESCSELWFDAARQWASGNDRR